MPTFRRDQHISRFRGILTAVSISRAGACPVQIIKGVFLGSMLPQYMLCPFVRLLVSSKKIVCPFVGLHRVCPFIGIQSLLDPCLLPTPLCSIFHCFEQKLVCLGLLGTILGGFGPNFQCKW